MLEEEIAFAIELVTKASKFSLQFLSELQTTDCFIKPDGSPVTVADFTLQSFINHEIKKCFPHDAIMGEEDSSFLEMHEHLRKRLLFQLSLLIPSINIATIKSLLDLGNYPGGSSERFWVIDPIDGTKGFIRKEQYAIACALIDQGEVVLGVVGCPNLIVDGKRGIICSARAGEETTFTYLEDGKPFKVKKNDHLLCTEPREDSKTHLHQVAEKAVKSLHEKIIHERLDSQVKYGMVALQQPALYLRFPRKKGHAEKIWDHAAGQLIVKCAGGEVTDVLGQKFDFSKGTLLSANWGVVASHGILHENVLKALQASA